MSGAITAAVGGAVVSGVIASKGSKDAAKTQANASREASQSIINETRRARTEILDRMLPALKDYGNAMDDLQQYVADGTVDVMNVLQSSTDNALQVLQQSGADAKQAIIGSAASASGVPRQQFMQQYSRIQSLPPEQQQTAMNQFASQSLGRSSGFSLGKTGADLANDQMKTIEYTRNKSAADQQAARGYSPFEGRDGLSEKTSSPFEGRESTGTSQAFNGEGTISRLYEKATQEVPSGLEAVPEYQYTGMTDRGTPGFNIQMAQTSPGVYEPAQGSTPATGTGFYGAVQQFDQGKAQGLAQLAAGAGQARQDVLSGTYAGLKELQPYSDAGRAAMQQEAALSGALGPEAQQQAIDSFIESPGQKYLREQQEQALLRNSAAIGGLGGGRVRTALQEQAMGIAATQQQQYLTNLRDIASRGQNAATTGAGMYQTAGTQLAELADSLGVRGADLTRFTAAEKAQLANQTGLSIAALDQAIGAASAGQLATLGGQLSSVLSGSLTDIASLGQQSATNQLQGQQDISTLLANLAVQGATQSSPYTFMAGQALATGQAQAGATMGQTIQDVGNIAAYTLANRAAATPTNYNPSGYYPGTVLNTGAHIGTNQTTAFGM
jgi:hypothetical protein